MNISLSFPAAEPAISSFLFHKLNIDIEFKEIQTKDAEAWEALSYHTCIYYMTYSDGRFFFTTVKRKCNPPSFFNVSLNQCHGHYYHLHPS